MKYSATMPAAYRIKTGDQTVISFRVTDHDRPQLARIIKHVEREKNVQQYRVTIEPVKRPRTTGKHSQNTYINGAIALIAGETGNDIADVKLYVKRRAMRRGYPAKTDDSGHTLISLVDGEPIPQSESEATVEEAKILIEEVQQLAAELDILLPG